MIIVVAIVGLAGLVFVERELCRLSDQADQQGSTAVQGRIIILGSVHPLPVVTLSRQE